MFKGDIKKGAIIVFHLDIVCFFFVQGTYQNSTQVWQITADNRVGTVGYKVIRKYFPYSEQPNHMEKFVI